MRADRIDRGAAAQSGQGLGFASFLAVWAGQLVSMLGSGLSSFGLMVWLYERTHAATPYALAFLTSTLPFIFFAPLAGHLVDRRSRKAIIILADSGDALVTLAILVLVAQKRLEPWMVYLITFLSSSFQCFQEPAWASAVPTLVAKKQLGRANGLEGVSQACFGAGALAGGLLAAIWGGPKSKKVPFVMGCIGMAAVSLFVTGIRPSLALQSSGLLFVFAGLALLAATFVVFLRPSVRNLEENLPDVI